MITSTDITISRSTPLPVDSTSVQAIAVADLTGNGLLDSVLRFVDDGRIHLTAIAHSGETLWRFDTGLPARGGWDGSGNHVPFVCWDFNGEGYASVATHAAGTAWQDITKDSFYDIGTPSGEELVLVDGRSGQVRGRTAWPAWKPRVMMTVAHLDGGDQPASLVICDETYGQEVITVIDTPDMAVRWRCHQGRAAGHNVDVGDVDGDGCHEIIVGGICYRGDGSVLWRAERFGHTDMTKPAKVDPSLPGLQTWVLVEGQNPGVYLLDQAGETLWHQPYRHAHFGWIGKQSHDIPGLHPHAAEDGRKEQNFDGMREDPFPIFDCYGNTWCSLSNQQRKAFMPIAWHGDGLTDFIDRKEGVILRLAKDGSTEFQVRLPPGLVYQRNLVRYAEGNDERESIITVDRNHNTLVSLQSAIEPTRGRKIPKESFAYRHDRSQTGSGYYLYCCYHEGWDSGMQTRNTKKLTR